MKTYKGFLTERLAEPEQLANRVARRYGTADKIGKYHRVEPGGHIPLKGFNKITSDTVMAKADKIGVHNGKKTTMNVKDLKPTQPVVFTHDPDKLKAKIADRKPGHIYTATHKGKHYVLDGHHSLMAAKLRGEKTVETTHLDMDKH